MNLSTIKDFENWLINVHEKENIELKKSSDFPTSFWETYSSFCNTSGGLIFLGVKESENQNVIVGINNSEKILKTLWDQLSNPNKVSFRMIESQDVSQIKVGDKTIIAVRVKEAPESIKPVYINNKIENSYIRTGDGDRQATKEEISSMLRNAKPIMDTLPADKFSLDDLDPESLITFKERINKRYPSKKYIEMNNKDFLKEIGACYVDRETHEYKIKRGTLLFLGKINSIKEIYPSYHVDYFNYNGNNPRWNDRVTDDEPSDYEMNLYNFYTIVYDKLRMQQTSSFQLDSSNTRVPVSEFEGILRECIVNCLAHADYIQAYPSVKIEAFGNKYKFSNPGKLLVTKEQFRIGGDSRPRNEIVMKLFRLLGVAERQGFGGPVIYKVAEENYYRNPEIVSNLEKTELVVWKSDLADSLEGLSQDENSIIKLLIRTGIPVSVSEIQNKTGLTEYKARKVLKSLEQVKTLIEKKGNGSSTKYQLIKKDDFFPKLLNSLKNFSKD